MFDILIEITLLENNKNKDLALVYALEVVGGRRDRLLWKMKSWGQKPGVGSSDGWKKGEDEWENLTTMINNEGRWAVQGRR